MAPHLQQHMSQWIQGTDKYKYHMISFNHGIFDRYSWSLTLYVYEILNISSTKKEMFPIGLGDKIGACV